MVWYGEIHYQMINTSKLTFISVQKVKVISKEFKSLEITVNAIIHQLEKTWEILNLPKIG